MKHDQNDKSKYLITKKPKISNNKKHKNKTKELKIP